MFNELLPKSVLDVSHIHFQEKYSIITLMHYSDTSLILQGSKGDFWEVNLVVTSLKGQDSNPGMSDSKVNATPTMSSSFMG